MWRTADVALVVACVVGLVWAVGSQEPVGVEASGACCLGRKVRVESADWFSATGASGSPNTFIRDVVARHVSSDGKTWLGFVGALWQSVSVGGGTTPVDLVGSTRTSFWGMYAVADGATGASLALESVRAGIGISSSPQMKDPDIGIAPNGELIVGSRFETGTINVGGSNLPAPIQSSWVAKYDGASMGQSGQTQPSNPVNLLVTGWTVDSNGNVFGAGGYEGGDTDFGNGITLSRPYGANSFIHGFVVKYNAALVAQAAVLTAYSSQVNMGPGIDSLMIDSLGNVIVLGFCRQSTTIVVPAATFTCAPNPSISPLMISLSPALAYNWHLHGQEGAAPYATPRFYKGSTVASATDDSLYSITYVKNQMTLGSFLLQNPADPSSTTQGAVLKIDAASGAVLWARMLAPSSAASSLVRGIAFDGLSDTLLVSAQVFANTTLAGTFVPANSAVVVSLDPATGLPVWVTWWRAENAVLNQMAAFRPGATLSGPLSLLGVLSYSGARVPGHTNTTVVLGTRLVVPALPPAVTQTYVQAPSALAECPASCGHLEPPDNGSWAAPTPLPLDCACAVGSVCHHACNTGFVPVGTTARTCGPDTIWSSLACVLQDPFCPPISFAFGSAVGAACGAKMGDVCELACQPGALLILASDVANATAAAHAGRNVTSYALRTDDVLPAECLSTAAWSRNWETDDKVVCFVPPDRVCARGYAPPKCAVCADGWFREGKVCHECSSGSRTEFVVLSVVVGSLLLLVCAVVSALPDKAVDSVLLAMVTIQQVVVQVRAQPRVQDNRTIAYILRVLSFMYLDIEAVQPSCGLAGFNFVKVFWASIVISFGIVPAAFAAAALGYAYLVGRLPQLPPLSSSKFRVRWLWRFCRALVAIFVAVYLMLAMRSLQAVNCSGTLHIDASIACYRGAHLGVGVTAWMVLGVCFTVPIGFGLALMRVAASGSLERKWFVRTLGFFTDGIRPGFHMFKLGTFPVTFLVATQIALVESAVTRLVLGVLLFYVEVAALAFFLPYIKRKTNVRHLVLGAGKLTVLLTLMLVDRQWASASILGTIIVLSVGAWIAFNRGAFPLVHVARHFEEGKDMHVAHSGLYADRAGESELYELEREL